MRRSCGDITNWLIGPSGHANPEIQRLLLETLREQPVLAVVALIWNQFVVFHVFQATGSPWIFTVIVLDVVLFVLRIGVNRRFRNDSPVGLERTSQLVMLVNVLWLSVLGSEVLFLTHMPNIASIVLGTMVAYGVPGYVAIRFAAFPRLALLLNCIVFTGLAAGLIKSPFEELAPLWLLAPAGIFGFDILTRHLHRTLMQSVHAQYRNRQLSVHDPLTGLPNRLLMRERLGALCQPFRTEDGGDGFAVLCLDLDGFKGVNDRYGHAAGDRLLVRVAERLAAELAGEDLLSRVGGDEFVILLPGAREDAVIETAERLIATIGRPFDLGDGVNVWVGISIGAALCPRDEMEEAALLSRADDALYEVKRRGKGRWLFADGDARVIRARDGHPPRSACGPHPLRAFGQDGPASAAVRSRLKPAGCS